MSDDAPKDPGETQKPDEQRKRQPSPPAGAGRPGGRRVPPMPSNPGGSKQSARDAASGPGVTGLRPSGPTHEETQPAGRAQRPGALPGFGSANGPEKDAAPGRDGQGPSQAEQMASKVGGAAGKALGNKALPGVGGKIGEAVGSKAAAAVVAAVPLLLFFLFFILPVMTQDDSDTTTFFAEPGLVIDRVGPSGEREQDAIHQDIPEEFLEAYLEAASRHGVPWPLLAAVGRAASDHGRFSPYDNACPLRDPLANSQRAQQHLERELEDVRLQLSVNAAALKAAELRKADPKAAPEASDPEGQDGAGALNRGRGVLVARELALSERIALLAADVELLGTSHGTCLRDRDPDRLETLPPGTENLVLPPWDFVPAGEDAGARVPPPDAFRFNLMWGRWARDWDEGVDGDVANSLMPAPGAATAGAQSQGHEGPMMLAAGTSSDPNVSLADPVSSVMLVAELLAQARADLEIGDGNVDWQVDPQAADSVWGQAVDLLPSATLVSAVGPGCPFDPAGPTDQMIENIWRCELSGRTLHLIYDVSVVDGSPRAYRTLPVDRAVDALVAEALQVAAGFSNMGERRCDAMAEHAGVFPLTAAQAAAAGVERCDRAGNIAAAARVVASGEQTLPAARLAGQPYQAMVSGWSALTGALGSPAAVSVLLERGPAGATERSPVCVQEADRWAEQAIADPGSPVSPLWVVAQPPDAIEQVRSWAGATFASSSCPNLSPQGAARLARNALRTRDTDFMYASAGSPQDAADLLALQVSLLAAVQDQPPLPAPQWGQDSFVPRLSSRELGWVQLERSTSQGVRVGLEPSYFVVPMAVRYGGTVPGDERAGEWQLSPGSLWAAGAFVLTGDEIDRLFESLQLLAAGQEDSEQLPSALRLSEEAEVGLVAAVRFLALYRQAAQDLGRAPSAREILDVVYQTPVAGANGLLCPVDGARAGANPGFINDWQFCRGENCSRRHEGNDIFAPTGTPIRAVADAVVVRVRCPGCGGRGQGWGDYSELGGITVTYRTLENGWEWYNAHLHTIAPEIAPGVRVAQGTIVGTVGRTGNARTTPPHNHLGLFVGGRPVNPFPVTSISCR